MSCVFRLNEMEILDVTEEIKQGGTWIVRCECDDCERFGACECITAKTSLDDAISTAKNLIANARWGSRLDVLSITNGENEDKFYVCYIRHGGSCVSYPDDMVGRNIDVSSMRERFLIAQRELRNKANNRARLAVVISDGYVKTRIDDLRRSGRLVDGYDFEMSTENIEHYDHDGIIEQFGIGELDLMICGRDALIAICNLCSPFKFFSFFRVVIPIPSRPENNFVVLPSDKAVMIISPPAIQVLTTRPIDLEDA